MYENYYFLQIKMKMLINLAFSLHKTRIFRGRFLKCLSVKDSRIKIDPGRTNTLPK